MSEICHIRHRKIFFIFFLHIPYYIRLFFISLPDIHKGVLIKIIIGGTMDELLDYEITVRSRIDMEPEMKFEISASQENLNQLKEDIDAGRSIVLTDSTLQVKCVIPYLTYSEKYIFIKKI